MKKFLSLVLALVMTFSLVTVSAGAKDFTDKDSIKYAEAVDVMTACKVIDGYANGSFNPSNTLTRGAAAKIICNMILGPTTASALGCSSAPFSDVPANHTFAGYISYCASQGIINGYGDGTFKPAGTVTGYQFLKMLLGALGYDATIEKFVGSNWSVNVAKLAVNLDLTKGNDSFVGSKAMTREEACLYAFNTLKATMVDYDTKGTTITVNGATIVSGASKAEAIKRTTGTDYTGVAEDENGTLQFCEKYFSKLTQGTSGYDTDNFGRPTNVWYYDGAKVGSYDSKTPVLTLTEKTKEKDIFTKLGVDGISGSSAKYVVMDKIYEDGVLVAESEQIGTTGQYQAKTTSSPYKESVVIAKGDKSDTVGTGNGVQVEFYKTSTANHYVMVVIHQYFGKVSSVTKATAGGADRKINLTLEGTSNGSFETEDFAKNDYVVATKSAGTIKTVAKAQVVENVAVTAYSDSSVTAGGTTYKYSQLYTGGKTYNMTSKDAYTFYLDSNGYIIKSESYSAGVTDAVLVVAVGSPKSMDDFQGSGYYTSTKYVNAEGKVTTVKATATDENTAAVAADGWYTVKEDSDNDGYYVFTKVAAYDPSKSSTTGQVTASASGLKNTKAQIANGIVANSATTFVLRTDSNTYKVYTGIASVPQYTDPTTAYALVKDGYATTVYLDFDGKTSSSDADELIYLFDTDAKRTEYDATNKVYYNVFDAIVDGEVKEVKVANNATVYAGLVKITAYDNNNYIKTLSEVKTGGKYTVNATLADNSEISFEGGVLTVAGTAYVVDSNAVVYMIDSDDAVTETTADALAGDVDGASYIALIAKSDTNGTITTIYFDGNID